MSAERRRLFFALWPDAAARDRLRDLRERLPTGAGRPTHPHDLHLTLAFLGGVDAATRACVEQAAGRLVAAPFTLRLDRIGCWGRAGILWCAPAQPPPELLVLQAALWRALADGCGLRPEARPFRPHVTLARKARRCDERVVEPVNWRADAFVLAESRSGPGTPRYRVLKKWPMDS